MKVAVLSGKGGAGKTMVAVNLAVAAGNAVYIDCDVEEPNGRLFLKPEHVTKTPVCTRLPKFNGDRCSGCRACVDFCRFHALVYIKGVPKLFADVCHSCGGCMLVCPEQAISEMDSPVGHIEQGNHGPVRVITGVLNTGEASGVPVIHSALKAGFAAAQTAALSAETPAANDAISSADGPAVDDAALPAEDLAANGSPLTVIDCPPGSACSVMESIADADCCLLVAEPTAFAFHNFRMVWELATLLGKPCGVIINKMDAPFEPLEAFCREQKLPVLMRIPFSQKLARLAAEGGIPVESDPEFAADFAELLEKIGGVIQ